MTSLSHRFGDCYPFVANRASVCESRRPAERVFDVLRASHLKRPRASWNSVLCWAFPAKQRILRPVSYAECEAIHTPITISEVDSMRGDPARRDAYDEGDCTPVDSVARRL